MDFKIKRSIAYTSRIHAMRAILLVVKENHVAAQDVVYFRTQSNERRDLARGLTLRKRSRHDLTAGRDRKNESKNVGSTVNH